MVIYGTDGLADKKQAYDLLRRGAERHWGMKELPRLERQPGGKPFFPELENRQFNLSHSGEMALCALDERPVGVDIQVIRPCRAALLDRVCSAEERAWLKEQEDQTRAFALLWALKESRVKYEGRGIIGTGEMIRGIKIPIPPAIGESMEWDGLRFCCYEGDFWMAAVCGESCPPTELVWLSGK